MIELMVVAGLVALLAGVGALAIAGRGGEGAALANAQNIVAGLVGSTRAQAALHQTRTRLAVYAEMPPGANADADKYLRALVVLREDPVDSGRYVAAGAPVLLPPPICVVPPSPVPANHLRAGVVWNNNINTGPVSTLTVLAGFSYRGASSGGTAQFFGRQGQGGRILHLDFSPDGTVASGTSAGLTKIALTTAVLAGNALPAFNNASGVRGVVVRRSGAVALIDAADGF